MNFVFNPLRLVACLSVVAAPLVSAIIGGSAAKEGQFPNMVSVWRTSHIFGGILINSRQVITAASCVHGTNATDFTVRAGSLSHASGGNLIHVDKITTHPLYISSTFTENIAILEPIQAVGNVQPIKLPEPFRNLRVGSTTTVAGWGPTSERGALSTSLQFVKMPIVEHSECQQQYSGYLDVIREEFCAGVAQGGKGSCDAGTLAAGLMGDMGGPVLQGNTLIGVISVRFGCARPSYPDIYTDVSSYVEWIDSKTIE
ncbi:Trypsin Blo t 3 [Cladobotryum mycophilum]|uniref:Trypsin Blo t 3 n=1 Tax=Cladobotryum mycophilum TaxID=491253 RepID=A0ABR0T137_9HYPO